MKKIVLILAFITASSTLFGAQGNRNRRNLRNKILLTNVQANVMGRKVLRITNRFRVQQGLNRLEWNQDLFRVAKEHAQKMANKTAPFNHDGFLNRIKSFKRRPRLTGENLFKGINLPGDIERFAVQAWKKSPGHRANLLKPSFNTGAIGVAIDRNGMWYMTQFLAQY
jgi:uncharacterized protein YkwD